MGEGVEHRERRHHGRPAPDTDSAADRKEFEETSRALLAHCVHLSDREIELVVDDEQSMRVMLEARLAKAGHAVEVTAAGAPFCSPTC